MEGKKCISCKKKIDNSQGSVSFKCPNCGKYDVVRCGECRKSAVKYICPQCEFKGPN